MVFKKIYNKILNSSNSFKFYKNQYNKLKLENNHMWDDIRHKDKVIMDKDEFINTLKKENHKLKKENDHMWDDIRHKDKVIMDKDEFINTLKKQRELFKSENKILISENRQLQQYNYDMKKLLDENEHIKNQYIQSSNNLNNKIETLTSKSNKILSSIEFSQVESTNNFDTVISKLDDNIQQITDENKEIQKHLKTIQQKE